jgi:hypothetical protein
VKRTGRLYAMIAAGLVLLVLCAEVAFRAIAGDKLLYRADPEIEYLPLSDQNVRQRGVEMRTNAWGMRSPSILRDREGNVFRLLVVGDSVVFGYININQRDLATTQLWNLALKHDQRLETLNVSASSWGPGNMLAWLDAHPALGVDAAILVLSSHDIKDDRTFGPLESDFPQGRPLLGSLDWVLRRLPSAKPPIDPRTQGDAARSLPLLFDRLAALPNGACLILHETQEERQKEGPSKDGMQIALLARQRGIPVIDDLRFISVVDGFSDSIHLSAKGQAQLADAIKTCPAVADRLAG